MCSYPNAFPGSPEVSKEPITLSHAKRPHCGLSLWTRSNLIELYNYRPVKVDINPTGRRISALKSHNPAESKPAQNEGERKMENSSIYHIHGGISLGQLENC